MKPETISIGQELKLSTKFLDPDKLNLLSPTSEEVIVVFYMWITRYTECVVIVPSRYLVAVETTPMATKWILPFSDGLFSQMYYFNNVYSDKGTLDRLTDPHSLEERLAIVEAQLDTALNKLDKLDKLDDKLDRLIEHLIPQGRSRY